jgi:hypothetical protein
MPTAVLASEGDLSRMQTGVHIAVHAANMLIRKIIKFQPTARLAVRKICVGTYFIVKSVKFDRLS